MRPFRTLLVLKLGAWVGMLAAAAFIKRAIPSRGDEESDEVSLVAVFDGIDLKSRAKAFSGGSMMAWFGGIAVDLRDAELVPGARLTVHALFGGVELQMPPTWRVSSNAKALFGGVDVRTPAQNDLDAPVLSLEGAAIFGGIEVSAQTDDTTEDS